MKWADYKKALQKTVDNHQEPVIEVVSESTTQIEEDEDSQELDDGFDEDLVREAVEEAKLRESRKDELSSKPVDISVEINARGEVSLSFNRNVAWPSYMIKLL